MRFLDVRDLLIEVGHDVEEFGTDVQTACQGSKTVSGHIHWLERMVLVHATIREMVSLTLD